MHYNGPDFIEASKVEVHKDYCDEYYEDVSGHQYPPPFMPVLTVFKYLWAK